MRVKKIVHLVCGTIISSCVNIGFLVFLLGWNSTIKLFSYGYCSSIISNIISGVFLYGYYVWIRAEFADWLLLRALKRAMPFKIRLLKVSDPLCMAIATMRCYEDGCGGFLAARHNFKKGDEIFCLRCKKSVLKDKLDKLLKMGAKLWFE